MKIRRCALLNVIRPCRYRIKLPPPSSKDTQLKEEEEREKCTTTEWFPICSLVRNRVISISY